MASHPDQRAAAGHRPLRGVRGMRAGVALLPLHEQDFVFRGLEDLHGLGHRRRVDPVLRIHEEPAGLVDRRAGRGHFFQHPLVHQCLGHMLADRQLVAFAPEVARERLFADHMLAGLHRLDDHRRVQIGRRADVDDIDIGVGDQVAKAAIRRRDLVAAGKLDDMIASCRNGPDFNIHAVDTPVGMHVQLGHEAAASQADPDFRHCASASRLSWLEANCRFGRRPCGASTRQRARSGRNSRVRNRRCGASGWSAGRVSGLRPSPDRLPRG